MTLIDTPPCYRCNGTVSEPIRDGVAACCYCGVLTRVRGLVAPEPPAPLSTWRLSSGRFAGKTLAEVAAEPNGRRYLEALRDSSPELRGRIEEFFRLDSLVAAGNTDAAIVGEPRQLEAKDCHAKPLSSPLSSASLPFMGGGA